MFFVTSCFKKLNLQGKIWTKKMIELISDPSKRISTQLLQTSHTFLFFFVSTSHTFLIEQASRTFWIDWSQWKEALIIRMGKKSVQLPANLEILIQLVRKMTLNEFYSEKPHFAPTNDKRYVNTWKDGQVQWRVYKLCLSHSCNRDKLLVVTSGRLNHIVLIG